jgi:NADH:ubiquinone oxidoreductase subunit K
MLSWLDFFVFVFILSIGLFITNNKNFVSILLFAELTWLILYVISVIVGSHINDINAVSFTFFILGFGGLEFVIGFMLVILMKNMNISLASSNLKNNSNNHSSNNLNSKKFNI